MAAQVKTPKKFSLEQVLTYGYCPIAYEFRWVKGTPYKYVSPSEVQALVLRQVYRFGLAHLGLHGKLDLSTLTAKGNSLWKCYLGRLPGSVRVEDFLDFLDRLNDITETFYASKLIVPTYPIQYARIPEATFEDEIDLITSEKTQLNFYFFETKQLELTEVSYLTRMRASIARLQLLEELRGEGFELKFWVKNLNTKQTYPIEAPSLISYAKINYTLTAFVKAIKNQIYLPRLQSPFAGCEFCNYRTVCDYREI